MNALAAINVSTASLPSMVELAAKRLAEAANAAEILEAKEEAGFAYDAAKKAARFAKAKGAHDELIAKAHRAQADALEIEAAAKRRLADEYDAAQERGEVASRGGERSGKEHSALAPTAADIGLTRKEIHEARQVRDAEIADPGIVRRTLDERLENGDEPTKAALRSAVASALTNGFTVSQTNRNPLYRPDPARQANNRIVALFREVIEVLEAHSSSSICEAFLDEEEKQRGVIAAYKASDKINEFLEVANA